jgi:hypothetical protein
VLGLLALVVAFNPGLVFFGRVLAGYDTFVYFYPLREYLGEALWEKRLPLWNPYLFAGTPFLANPQTAIFYPGSWLFALGEAPYAYALNFLGHIALAAIGLYAFARASLGLGRLASMLGGAGFAFSGFMNGQAGHINQFSVAAWLPSVALFLDLSLRGPGLSLRSLRPWPFAALVAGLTLQIAAGHPQEVYMTVAALGLLVLWRCLPAGLLALVRGGLILGLAIGLAAGISAVQLLPTLELSGLSIRGGGLSYQDASFGALPWPLLLPSLFPGYWAHLPTTEFFGHTGTICFALAWLGLLAGRGRAAILGALYVALGLLLAVGDATFLYQLLFDWAPGFASFRVPARWLFVSTFGLALLAATGADWLIAWSGGGRPAIQRLASQVGPIRFVLAGVLVPIGLASLLWLGQRQSGWHMLAWGALTIVALALAAASVQLPKLRPIALALLLGGAVADLWVAGYNLEHRNPVPIISYHQLGDGIAALFDKSVEQRQYRSLSIATPEYIVKETEEYEQRYANLGPLGLENLLVEIKWNETLWPNLPLEHNVRSADGYDGGVLPTRLYYDFTRAMLGDARARPDGVLASRLDALPEDRWLDLLGVRLVLASRAKDLTRGAIYYDRAVTATLRPGQRVALESLPLGEFTRLGMISTVTGTAAPGEQVGTVRMVADGGPTAEIPLIVGQNTAPSNWQAEQAPGIERVQSWSQNGPTDPADWIAELAFGRQPVTRIEIVNNSPGATVLVRSLNLIDDGRQMAFPITPNSQIDRTEFFDVKLYDRRQALARTYVVPAATVLDDDAAARQLADPSFDPRVSVILAPSATAGQPGAPPPAIQAGQPEQSVSRQPSIVRFEADAPERVVVHVAALDDSYLVLSDSWYPGWRAFVDGAEVPIERANLLFRAVAMTTGEHTVEFRFEPASVRRGMVISIVSLGVTVLAVVGLALWQRRYRADPTVVKGPA